MEQKRNIRRQQRFTNYKKVIAQLHRFPDRDNLNEMEEQGLVKAFEYTYELSRKTLQDLFKEKGLSDILGPTNRP